MGCDCDNINNSNNTNPIHVWVELAGKEKFHAGLKGRDEENQHPISAITNLEDTLDELSENILDLQTTQEADKEQLTEDISNLSDTLEQGLEDLSDKIDNIDLSDYYTKQQTDTKLTQMMRYKGSVSDYQYLPVIDNQIGDVYNTVNTGANYIWTGNSWDNLSPSICLKKYATKDYVDASVDTGVKLIQDHLSAHYYNKEEINEIIEDLDPTTANNVFVFKGSVISYENLPRTTSIGDVYITLDTKNKYFWSGFEWELLQEGTSLAPEDIEELVSDKADKDYVDTQFTTLSNKIDQLETAVNESKQWYGI